MLQLLPVFLATAAAGAWVAVMLRMQLIQVVIEQPQHGLNSGGLSLAQPQFPYACS